MPRATKAKALRVLAIDTSLTKSGWAVLSVTDRKPSVIDFGLIKSDAKLTDGERLRQIVDGINGILAKYPEVERTVPREEGIVRHNIATRQVFKAHGSTEYALADYVIEDVNIQTVKAWARRVTGVKGDKGIESKKNVEQAVMLTLGLTEIPNNKGYDISDAMAVGIVYLKRKGAID